jgi:hypothetical protein
MGTYGQELLVDTLGYMVGAIAHLGATPPTSIVGVILWVGYIGEAVLSHLRAGSLSIAVIALGLCLASAAWAMLGSRDRSLRIPMPA